MLERIKSFLLISVIALTIWLFAEAESLSSYSGITRVQFISGEGSNRTVRVADGFSGSVSVEVEGSRVAIDRAREILSAGVRLELGKTGVPFVDGAHSVNLVEAIQAYRPLAAAGVQVTSVSPQNVSLRITELETRQVPVDASLPGVQIVGAIRITPESLPVRLPRSEWEAMKEPLRLVVRLGDEQIARLPAGGVARVEARALAPASTSGVDPFPTGAGNAVVSLEFTVKDRNATAQFAAVPVQVLLPPIEAGVWRVQIESQDQFLTLEATGPSETIERLQAADAPLIALLALSSDDLERGIASKEVSFGQLRAGVLAPLPESVKVSAAKSAVRFTVTRAVGP